MTQFILFFISIHFVFASNCFSLKDNVVINQSTIIVNGIGKMCSCVNYTDKIWSKYGSTIKTVSFENSVTSIGMNCFMNFTKLDKINFGKGIEQIHQNAFSGTSIESLQIPSNVISIESHSFNKNNNLKIVDFLDDGENVKFLSVELYAFSNNKNLEKVIFSKNFKNFDSKIFFNCKKLKEIIVDENNANYKTINKILYDKTGKEIIFVPPGLKIETAEIEEGVEIIGKNYLHLIQQFLLLNFQKH